MKRIVIIGGGVAGLTAGITAQMHGFSSVILEKHHVVGGECTGWDRQGYHIDGCIHWLVGTQPGTALRQLWDDVGALDGVDIYYPESFLTTEYEGTMVPLPPDLDQMEKCWVEISPEDRPQIEAFVRDIRSLHSFRIPAEKPMDMLPLWQKAKLMLSMKDAGRIMQKYGKISLREFAGRFSHPALRYTLASFVPEGHSASSIFFALGSFTQGNAGIPSGGSRALAERMVKRYQDLGGEIQTQATVRSLERTGRTVIAAVTEDGRHFTGDYFAAACDPIVVFQQLLQNEYHDRQFAHRYANPVQYPLASNIYIGLGLEGSPGPLARTVRFAVEPIPNFTQTIEDIQLTHYAYESDFAPAGHTALTVAINQFAPEVDAWFALAKENDQKVSYNREKQQLADTVKDRIITQYPQFAGRLRILDIATPVTYNRYCSAYRGSFMAFLPSLRGKSMAHNGRIKGLKNFHLTGQWLQPPGGLPVALLTGRDTILRIAAETGQRSVH